MSLTVTADFSAGAVGAVGNLRVVASVFDDTVNTASPKFSPNPPKDGV